MSTRKVQVVGIGLATVDVLLRCEEADGDGLQFSDFHLEGGGPVATALCAASKLGTSTGYVGTAGGDFAGDAKLLSLERYGVDVSRAVRRPGPERQVILVRVDANTGERRFTGMGGFRQDPVRPDELDRDYVTSADCLHLDGMHTEAARAAAEWMQAAGKTVVYDGGATRGPVREETRDLLEHVDVLICGSGFAQALTGLSDTADACRAARDCGPGVVVQTEGADGAFSSTPEGDFHTPAFTVDVVDTTGAGDVFHGAYLVGLLKGWDHRRIAVFATAVAAMKCSHMGGRAGVGTFEETVQFLREHGVDVTG